MIPSSARLPQTHLLTGQLLITREAQLVTTVLGSCVTLTMFERATGLAAICHAALPASRTPATSPAAQERFRYVDHAVPAMLAAFQRAGINPRAIEVKLFGGADVLGHGHTAASGRVGHANVAMARQLLAAARLPVSRENTLGHSGRKILFNTATGEVLHKQLRRLCR